MDNTKQEATVTKGSAGKVEGTEPRKISFQELVCLMGGQALAQLGVVPNPLSGKTEVQLAGAQQTIDILALLETKTEGNLTEEEKKVLGDTLYNLRLRYVEVVKAR